MAGALAYEPDGSDDDLVFGAPSRYLRQLLAHRVPDRVVADQGSRLLRSGLIRW